MTDEKVSAELVLKTAGKIRDFAAKPDRFLEELDAYIARVEDGRYGDKTSEVAAVIEELRACRDNYAAAGHETWRSSLMLGALAKHPVLVDVLAKLKDVIVGESPGSVAHEQFSAGLRAIEDGMIGIPR